MFTVVDLSTGKTDELNFDQLNKRAGGELDEAFYTKIFAAHTLTVGESKLVVTEGSHD